MNFPQRFFITGTDTGVGKTVVSALLAAGLNAGYWKPVQSGSQQGLDSSQVQKLSGLDPARILPEAYVLPQPLSPHLAAEREGLYINPEKLAIPQFSGRLVIEGAGGIMVPLNREMLILDWVKKMSLPVLVVAPNRLGVINHTLMTVSVLRQAEVPVLGVILNFGVNSDHVQAIEHFAKVPVLAQIKALDSLSPGVLMEIFLRYFG